jgi:hypothetical protein
MEKFNINFRSNKPRLSIYMDFNVNTLPVVGDILRIPKEYFTDISKKRKDRIYNSLEFKVIERKFAIDFINPNKGFQWFLEIDFNDDYLHRIDDEFKKQIINKQHGVNSIK